MTDRQGYQHTASEWSLPPSRECNLPASLSHEYEEWVTCVLDEIEGELELFSEADRNLGTRAVIESVVATVYNAPGLPSCEPASSASPSPGSSSLTSSVSTRPTEPDPTIPVLIVEDKPQLARAMVRTLKRAGFSVTVAANFAEASALVNESGVRFDAAVLEHKLPDGDSRELVSALASREPSCSSLILTGYRDHQLALEYRGKGAFRFAAKPVAGIQLLTHVHATMLDTHRWRGASLAEAQPNEEPPVVVDMEQAADRLTLIARLSPTE